MRTDPRAGQSLIESCVVVAVTSLLLFGILQVSQVLAAREILEHAAARGARAKTVGLNRWMVRKVVDVATIPNAGRMLTPDFYVNRNPDLHARGDAPGDLWDTAVATMPVAEQAGLELARIPEYLGAENVARARFILDYQDWDTIRHWVVETGSADPDTAEAPALHVRVEQDYRLWAPMHRAFWADDDADLAGDSRIENHYPLYLTDMAW